MTALGLDVGKATERGVELATQQNNDEGILDAEMTVESANTEGQSTAAAQAHNTLVNRQGADATLGTFAEQTASGIMSEVADTEMIHLNVGAVSPALPAQVAEDYERFKPWFRVASINAAFFRAGHDKLRRTVCSGRTGLVQCSHSARGRCLDRPGRSGPEAERSELGNRNRRRHRVLAQRKQL
ncbi:ABC transporter substrate-binding protein [Halorubrum sp. Atlit-28R]|uniref:ABC transporter substrate-binding protein n=1 Tax=Halorubrum sp. Atlit-28R TaxID=2282129 RepID=UPI0034E0B43C